MPDRTVFFWDHFRLDGDPLAALNQSVDNHNSLHKPLVLPDGMCHFFYFHLASTGQCAH